MNKKEKKKGFTLIELLAVIAILALLIILVVPNIIKIYEGAKKQTFLTEAKTVYREAERKVVSEEIKGNKITKINSEDETKLSIKGKRLKYCIEMQEEKVKSIAVSDGEYYIEVVSISKIEELTIEKMGKGEYDDLPCYTGGQEIGKEYTFEESEEHEFVAPSGGIYKLEIWGAQGGYSSSSANGGKGGYSKGEVALKKGDKLYIYVGGSGNSGGFNGGGNTPTTRGGGATDMRIGGNSLYHRFIVAGGGGSNAIDSASSIYYTGGSAGGTSGTTGSGNNSYSSSGGVGGSQITGSSFGNGGNSTSNSAYSGAGGGGWYGGFGGATYLSGNGNYFGRGGGGGSGYIWTSSTSSNVPSGYKVDTKYYLFNYEIKRGNETMPNPTGGIITGKEGNGYAKITYTGKDTRKKEFVTSVESNTPYGIEEPGIYKLEIPKNGKYKLEVWGAQGGYSSSSANGGKGGYSKGEVNLTAGEIIYIYVGSSGNTGEVLGGFNGGGSSPSYGGGGASDMRIGGTTLNHRFIVAGGGGSNAFDSASSVYYTGGSAGGTSGIAGSGNSSYSSSGGVRGTQTTGSSFGKGGSPSDTYSGAGGGGWYGGFGGVTYLSGNGNYFGRGGGGGSGYIWTSSTSSNVPSEYAVDTKYYLFNYEIKRGNETMPNPTGEAMTGKLGNGYARITYLGKDTRKEEFVTSVESKTPYGISEPGIYKLEIPASGKYKLEVWGAQGGYVSSSTYGGKGGYSKGEVNLTVGEELYIYVGSSGNTGEAQGGFNGGGSSPTMGGGGATDMRIGGNTLYHRFIVAGGGGSNAIDSSSSTYYTGGPAGGVSGVTGSGNSSYSSSGGVGGTQTTGSSFGKGGSPSNTYSGGGGGGWYGGFGGVTYLSGNGNYFGRGGGGGSGYIWTSSTASNVPSGYLVGTKYYLLNAQNIAGNVTNGMPNPDEGVMTGKLGNGFACITYLGN